MCSGAGALGREGKKTSELQDWEGASLCSAWRMPRGREERKRVGHRGISMCKMRTKHRMFREKRRDGK